MKLESSVTNLIKMKPIERLIGEKKDNYLKRYVKKGEFLATLIIGVRVDLQEPWRLENLTFMLSWLNHYYEDVFDILIVEQDVTRRIDPLLFNNYKNVRYEYVFNDKDYNRGWGYNVAVKHFCSKSKVVVLMDTDVLPAHNFLSEVRDCYIDKFKVCSPYQNIYYCDESETDLVKKSYNLLGLNNKLAIKNPVTITGGILIINRNTYMELNGFEQYIGYGCEDRAFDVCVTTMINSSEIRIAPYAYPHIYHPTDKKARQNWNGIYKHLQDNYGCTWHKELTPFDYIHSKCEHKKRSKILNNIAKKIISFGDTRLYEKGNRLSFNGVKIVDELNISNVELPPSFSGFDYRNREVYKAPKADVDDIGSLRNAFLGKRCFIIGNGPSLNNHDLALLKDEYTFGVNSFYYKTRETGFRPTFYVVEDSSVMKENIEEIKQFHAPFKFFPTIYKSIHPKESNVFFFEMNRGFYEKSSPNYCVPRFSTDATKELFCGQSVTYINLQLAYFLGFTEVYLIGMDFSYIIPDSHKRTGDVLLSDTDDPNHFHKDYFGKGKTWKDPKLDRVGQNYKMAKLAYESVGRKISNATVGGSLEIFERVNYNSLFESKDSFDQTDFSFSFSEANKLYTEKRFSDALVIYLNLAEKNSDFNVYLRAAFDCYCLAKNNRQPIQTELTHRLQRLME